jgi:hypothetical protein
MRTNAATSWRKRAGEPAERRSLRPIGFGMRALGIGMFLALGAGLVLGWSSRHHRGQPLAPPEPSLGQVEGGI